MDVVYQSKTAAKTVWDVRLEQGGAGLKHFEQTFVDAFGQNDCFSLVSLGPVARQARTLEGLCRAVQSRFATTGPKRLLAGLERLSLHLLVGNVQSI